MNLQINKVTRSTKLFVLIFFFLVIVLSFAVWSSYQRNRAALKDYEKQVAIEKKQDKIDKNNPESWSVYENRKYGFKLFHPIGWYIEEGANSILILEKWIGSYGGYNNERNAIIISIASSRKPREVYENFELDCKNTIFSDKIAYLCSVSNEWVYGEEHYILIEYDKSVYVIRDGYDSDISKAVLDTFSFIVSDGSVADKNQWETYANERLGFSIDYPTTLTVESNEMSSAVSFNSIISRKNFSVDVNEIDYKGTDVEAWADQQTWPFHDGNWRNEFVVDEIAGRKALRGSDFAFVTFISNGKKYDIVNGVAGPGDYSILPIDQAIFRQAVESFKLNK